MDANVNVDIVAIAERIAREAHAGQTDKSGRPYIEHPVHVAGAVAAHGSQAQCVAWLHDVIEDARVTPADLLAAGLPQEVVDAVLAMTHREGEAYLDYVLRAKQNPLARAVKLADLAHNMDLSRLAEVRPRDLERQAKYQRAVELLQA